MPGEQHWSGRIQVFDPLAEFAVVQRGLPHWAQAGTICFITWRTDDSIPTAVLHTWLAERDAWLARHGLAAGSEGARLSQIPPPLLREYQRLFSDRWNDELDRCHGACVLRQPELATIVADSLLHFDGTRYELTDFVVMPNHVHVLAAFPDEEAMLAQCESWKHFTATKINRILGRRGRFWQQDAFDHLVRSPEYFEHYRDYIENNPRKANLRVGEYVYWTKRMRCAGR